MADFIEATKPDVGEATKASLPATMIDNDDNLNARLSLVEGLGIPNGSFEFPLGGGADADGWTATNTATGSHSVDTTEFIDGRQSFKAVVDAGGGFVTLINDTFSPVGGDLDDVFVRGNLFATAAARIRVEVKFYDGTSPTPSLIATNTILDTNETAMSGLSSWLRFRGWTRAPSTARFWKLNLILGDGATAADIYVDGLDAKINDPFEWVSLANTVIDTSVITETADTKIPIIGRAWAARCSTDIPAGHDFRWQGYLADSVAWSSTGGLYPRFNNSADDVDKEKELQCNSLGNVRWIYDHPNAGTLTLYYNAWR